MKFVEKSLLHLVIVLVTAALLGTGLLTYATKKEHRPEFHIGFERYEWQTGSRCCKWLRDTESGNIFRISVQGEPAYLDSWLENTTTKEGENSFGAWLKTPPPPATPDWKDDPNYVKQRVEFEISNGKYNTHHLEEGRYYGISMYIDPHSAAMQKKGVVFMQADQSHDTTYAKYPAFFLRFKDNSVYQWEVNVSSDSDADSRTTKGSPRVIYTSPYDLEKGMWHDFTIYFRPSIKGKGAIAVWHNGDRVVKQSHNRNLGYAPQPKPWVINNYFWIRFGAYRRPEPDRPGDILLLFDNASSSSTAPNSITKF